MTRVRSIAVALSLALGTVPVVAVLVPAAVQAAEPAAANKVTTKEVGKALKAAQEAMAKKQWDTAVAEIKKAQAVEKKTPFESYQIDEFLGFVLIQQKKYGEAAPVFERMINSGFLPPEQVDERMKTVAQLYSNQKDYRKAAEWAKKSLDRKPGQEDMGILLGQSQYLLNDWKGAATTMMTVSTNAEKAGRVPQENWLRIVQSAYSNLKDNEGIAAAFKKLVRYYPKEEYWDNLLDIYRRKDNSDRITLGYYRLMNDVGVLKQKGDYVEMAQLAMDAGVPGEAVQVVDNGIKNGTLKVQDPTEQGRYDRLAVSAKKLADQDQKSLPQLAKEAEKASSGQASVGLGQAYLSYGDYPKAIAAIEQGIKKGSVTDADEAQISLGIAYMKSGQKDQARNAFKAVKDDSKWNDLAELWDIRSQSA